ncbi:unnamed protein product [Rhizophagus irregularis]|nr:unnamed protein product [Rhizophagus irregularis]
MIRFGSRVGFRSTEPQRFLRVGFRVPKNGKPRFVSGGLPGSKEWKRTKIRSGGLPNSEERKIKIRFRVLKNGKKRTKVRSGGLPGSEERKRTKIRKFGRSVSSEERKNQDSFGWTSDKRGNQDLFGWASEERKPKDKDSIGRLPKNENPKIKISSGLSEERKKTKDSVSGSLEKVEPRFVWCLGWVPMNRKKPKIHQDS